MDVLLAQNKLVQKIIWNIDVLNVLYLDVLVQGV